MPTAPPGKRLAAVLRDIRAAEDTTYRGLERLMRERTGDRVTAAWMTNAVKGFVPAPRETEIRKLARAFPSFRERLWDVIGITPDAIPEDVASMLDDEANRRGVRPEDILRQAVEEFTRRPRIAVTSRVSRLGASA